MNQKDQPSPRPRAASPRILGFKTSAAFRRWLEKNHTRSDGLWLRFYKKASGGKSVTYAEALDQALCYGWIDGQARPFDKISWLHKFTPRRARSGWSRRNTEHAGRLLAAGLMAPAGLRAIAAAKADGRWAAAYDSPRNAQPPEDFLRRLARNKKAKLFFDTLNRSNIYAIVYRLQTAGKPEAREKRLRLILAMLERGETFHPQSRPAAPAGSRIK